MCIILSPILLHGAESRKKIVYTSPEWHDDRLFQTLPLYEALHMFPGASPNGSDGQYYSQPLSNVDMVFSMSRVKEASYDLL